MTPGELLKEHNSAVHFTKVVSLFVIRFDFLRLAGEVFGGKVLRYSA